MYPNLGDLQRVKECHYCAPAIRLKKRGTEHVDMGKEFLDRVLAIRLKKARTCVS